MTKKLYKGYEISAQPHQITGTDRWAVGVIIQVYGGGRVTDKQYQGPQNPFPTYEKAAMAGIAYGEWVIDEHTEELP